jgi:lipoic acid synthetase
MVVGGKPEWLKIRAPTGDGFTRLRDLATRSGINTVCDSSHCPNISECWSRGHLTFMVLGRTCTRACSFCAVEHGVPENVDPLEPERIGAAVRELGLSHAVVTSVTRDDLPDQGSQHFRDVTEAIRRLSPGTTIELLVPDMRSSKKDLRVVAEARPEVLSHNIETVERLQRIRDRRCSYRTSLETLSFLRRAAPGAVIKSSLMLGVGETPEEVLMTLRDLRDAGVGAVTMGQYLRPRGGTLQVAEYVRPEVFSELGEAARSLGFEHVASAPLVRSSYKAKEALSGRRNHHADR